MDKDRAEERFRLDEPRAALRVPAAEAESLPSFRDYVNALDVAAGAVTPAGEFLHANPSLVRLLQSSRGNARDSVAEPGFPSEVSQALQALAGRAVRGRSDVDIHMQIDGSDRNYRVVATPFGAAETPVIALSFHDMTRQVLIEQQAQQLMREVDHRVKNTMALVLSISNRTASNAETLDDFRSAFSGRIRALAATHNTLAERAWSSVRLADLLESELRPYGRSVADQVHLNGAEAAFLPRAAIALSLVLHELISNAARHGALSRKGGGVAVELTCQPGAPFAELKWREQGGPIVKPPSRSGFGQAVITRSLQYSPHGGADLVFHRDGVECTIRIPVEDLA